MRDARVRTGRFFRYELRTREPAAARAFYRAVLGSALDHPSLGIVPLPEAARARGAPAHWLGHVGVSDVEGVAGAIASGGGARLGPASRDDAGAVRVVLRDPFGAVLAVAEPPRAGAVQGGPVRWHVLNVEDPMRAWGLYGATLGWVRAQPCGTAEEGWPWLDFAWADGEAGAGTVAGTARVAGVHPHWLFLFGVPDLERSAATVRGLGGVVLPPVRTSSGGRAAGAEDPEGAAFGLLQDAPWAG